MKLGNKLQPIKGYYEGIDPEDYFKMTHAENAEGQKYVIASKSMLAKFNDDPMKWKHSPPFEKTAAMTGGSLLDCMLLTPRNLDREFILKPEDAPRRPTQPQIDAVKKSAKAIESISYWEAFDAKARGKELITGKQMDAAKLAVKQLKKHPRCAAIIEHSSKQTVCVAEYRGHMVKGMFDLVPDADSPWGNAVIDLKRTSGFTHAGFRKIIRQFKYHWQLAFYRWLLKETTGEDRDVGKIIISDSEAPYSCGLLTMHDDDIKRGHDEVFAALDKYIDCLEAGGVFPNPYPSDKPDVVLKSFYD